MNYVRFASVLFLVLAISIPTSVYAEDAGGSEAQPLSPTAKRILPPRVGSIAELPTPTSRPTASPQPQFKQHTRSLPLILTGLAVIGAGVAMVATHPETHVKDVDHLVENTKSGTIPCIATTFSTGGGRSSRNTMCSTQVVDHSPAYKAGVVMIPAGAVLAILGLRKR